MQEIRFIKHLLRDIFLDITQIESTVVNRKTGENFCVLIQLIIFIRHLSAANQISSEHPIRSQVILRSTNEITEKLRDSKIKRVYVKIKVPNKNIEIKSS